MWKQSVRPTPEAVEQEYCARVNAEDENCGVMRYFIEKVERLHEYVKDVIKRMIMKVKNVAGEKTKLQQITPQPQKIPITLLVRLHSTRSSPSAKTSADSPHTPSSIPICFSA
jgi:hypothetical protein